MSKLDDILIRTSDVIARLVVTGKSEKIDTKQQIKDMMLKIVKDSRTKAMPLAYIEKEIKGL